MSAVTSGGLSSSENYELPGLLPPAGVIPSLENPASQGETYTAVATTMIVVMLVIVTIRQYTKSYIIRKIGWDDWEYGLSRR